MPPMREQLEQLIGEMLTKGVRYDDAQREFEKRFITQALQAPQHAQPEDDRIPAPPQRLSPLAISTAHVRRSSLDTFFSRH